MSSSYCVKVRGGAEAGPMSVDDVKKLARSGELGPDYLIRNAASAQWVKAGSVHQLAAEFPRPPALDDALGVQDAVRASNRGTNARVDADADEAPRLKRADAVTLLLLSAVTMGIYGWVWFFGVLRSYRGITRRQEPNLEMLFWIYMGCAISGVALAFFFVGIVPALASVVVGAILLNHVLRDRAKIASELGGVQGLADSGFHLSLWISGQLLAVVLVGIPLAIYQAYRFVTDHNRIVAAAATKRPEWVES